MNPTHLSKLLLLPMLAILPLQVAMPQEPKARTSLATKGELWVGQQLAITVDLLAPGTFTGAPVFDIPDLRSAGILLMPPAGTPVVSSESIDGVAYTLQQYTLFAFTQHAGRQSIPPFDIRFHFKRSPLDPATVSAIVKTEAVSWTVKLPPGGEKLGVLISSHDLKVTEIWNPDPSQVKPKTGDAFTRTITYFASDVPAMIFPPFPHEEIDGIGIYPQTPEISERSNRGETESIRKEKIVYVCEKPGWVTIPSTSFTWWDLDKLRFQTIAFPQQTLQVVLNPAISPSSSAPSDGNSDHIVLRRRILVIVLTLLAGGFAIRLVPRRVIRKLLAPWFPVSLAPLNPPKNE